MAVMQKSCLISDLSAMDDIVYQNSYNNLMMGAKSFSGKYTLYMERKYILQKHCKAINCTKKNHHGYYNYEIYRSIRTHLLYINKSYNNA